MAARLLNIISAAVVLVALGFSHTGFAQPPKVSARLLANVSMAKPGDTILIGVLFNTPPKSHIYWHNPGDSGLPTTVVWNIPDGASVSELKWSTPKSFMVEGLREVFYGYEGEVLLFSELTLPESATDKISLAADVSWLLCLDDGVCIPGSTALELDVRIGTRSVAAPTNSTFEFFAKRLARQSTSDKFEAIWSEDQSELLVRLGRSMYVLRVHDGEPLAWYPEDGGGWDVDIIDSETLLIYPRFREEPASAGVLVIPVSSRDGESTIHRLQLPGPDEP